MNELFLVQIAAVVFATYLAFAAMWLQYLAVMNLKENRGKLTLAAKFWAYPMLVIGVISDILFNFIIGTFAYLEFPQELLFTARCSRHLKSSDWRKSVARWFCRNFMDPFDPDGKHCSGE